MGHWDLRVEMQWHHLRKTSFVHTRIFFSRWCTRSMRRVRIPTELRTLLQFVNGREKTYYLNKCALFFIPMTFLRVRFVLSDLATALTRVRDGRHSYSSLPQLLYLFFFLISRPAEQQLFTIHFAALHIHQLEMIFHILFVPSTDFRRMI